jgi:ribonucleoside-diphosphate reductase alpha chain
MSQDHVDFSQHQDDEEAENKAQEAQLNMIATHKRMILPTTRKSCTHKFSIAGHEGYLTVGLFDDGTPGEIFIKMSKEGSTLSGMVQGFCRAFSLALQYGLSIRDAVDRFRGMRFDPMGPTSNPEIPEALSILDYVARYLELKYLPREPEMNAFAPSDGLNTKLP